MTEQDVINEEMYEEEDDDLPLQYRRLTAHLQTGSADFNRRLAAYLTNQVAMRSAMEQMVNNNNGFQPQYGNPQYPQATSGMFQSPMLPPQHNMTNSPQQTYRAAPYPSPHHANFRQQHSRAYSMNGPISSDGTTNSRQSMADRRMSTPSNVNTNGDSAADYVRQTQSATMPYSFNMSPFSMSLPPESQQMLGPALDPNDPFSAQLMAGSEAFTNGAGYPWGDAGHGVKGMPVHPSAWPGMSATLAPSALMSTPTSTASTPGTSAPATSRDSVAPSTGLDFHFSQESKGLNLSNFDGFGSDAVDSGQVTPGEGFWDNFVHDNSWNEETTT